MSHHLLACYDETEDANASGDENNVQTLPSIPWDYSQLKRPCPVAIEGDDNAQASSSAPWTSGCIRRPPIKLLKIHHDSDTIQMLESVHDNSDLLVRKTSTMEVVHDMSSYEGDTFTSGVQDIIRGVVQLMVSQCGSSNLQEKLAFTEATIEELKKISALLDAKYKHDTDELEDILGKKTSKLLAIKKELDEQNEQVQYYINQNFAYAKKAKALEKDAQENDLKVKALRDTIHKQEEMMARDRHKYKRIFDNQFYQLWKNNQNLDLSYMPPRIRDKELIKCKARYLREVALPPNTTVLVVGTPKDLSGGTPPDATPMNQSGDTLP
ncbi:uncharacterized protein LOC115719969 [Cannabis sativa]|uniref:uncharacterized protein LOC115719969 n=1 Tax=Cannabis sativa TaxID=3483 RepID=UPI0029CA25F2|nr:uncharacterized protein LOC115719969 [Cannabis sativa]XP_030505048.2 uncharacterized protein LOC115719969 [Cannabis sativa]